MTQAQRPEEPSAPFASGDPQSPPWTADGVAEMLASGKVRGVRLWPLMPAQAVVETGAERLSWQCLTLDTADVAAKADYLSACAEQLPLPDYMGRNWDALEEALGDLGVTAATSGAAGLTVVWSNWTTFAAADPAAFQVALAVWRSVVADWRERLDGAAVILRMTSAHIDESALSESIVDELTGISRVRPA